MKNTWVFILAAVILVVVSTLAVMNNACKSSPN
jgi:xanthine/uracil permease